MSQSSASVAIAPPNRSPSLSRGTLLNLLGDGLPMVVGIIALRLLIPRLQDDRFTVLSLAWTAIAYFGMFDLGLGRALTQAVAKRLGGQEYAAIGPVMWTALVVIFVLGLCGAALVAVTAPHLVTWIGAPAALRGETRGVFYLLALAVPLIIVTTGLRGVLEAFGRFGLLAAIRISTGLLVYILPLTILPFTHNLMVIVAGLVMVRALGAALHFAACITVVPYACRRVAIDTRGLAELLSFGGWITGSTIVMPFLIYVDRFIVARVVYFDAAAYYGTPCDLIIRLLFIPVAVAGVLYPRLSAGLRGDVTTALETFDRGGRFIVIILMPVTLALVALGPEAILLWLGPKWAVHSGRVIQILAVGLFLGGMSQGPTTLLHACGRPDITAWLHFIELPLHVGIVLLLTYVWGIEGAAVAFVVRIALDYVALSYAACRILPGVLPSVARLMRIAFLILIGFAGLICIHGTALRMTLAACGLSGYLWFTLTRLLNAQERRMLLVTIGVRRSIQPR